MVVISADDDRLERRHTGTDRCAIDEHGAGAAAAFAATVFRASQAEILTEEIEQRPIFLGVDVDASTVDP